MYEESMGDGRVWRAPDEMASEYEVGDFLYGLIRLLKPQTVLETGCYRGDTTSHLLTALKANRQKQALLFTCDTNEACRSITEQCLSEIKGWGVATFVMDLTGEQLARTVADVDLAFLDSSGDRLAEAKALRMKLGGIVVLHDARRPVKEAIEKELGWKSIFIGTPRGLAIFQVGDAQ
jgi:predicted O-methyltransferase YrrM